MSKMKNFIIFSLGVATGYLATWQYFKTKYDQIAQDEIDSVKERFSKLRKSTIDKEEKAIDAELNQEIYEEIIDENGYVNYSDVQMKKDASEKPYVISPNDFGDVDYERISLTYYADEVLVDDNDEPINNIDEVVGIDSLTHFGEYEADSVYVRNDRLKCDYEILLDQGKYYDQLRPQQG